MLKILTLLAFVVDFLRMYLPIITYLLSFVLNDKHRSNTEGLGSRPTATQDLGLSASQVHNRNRLYALSHPAARGWAS